MHEWSMAEEIVRIVEHERDAQDDQYLRLTTLVIEVGAFSNVVTEALRFGLEVLLKNKGIEGVETVFEETPLIVRCLSCGAKSHLDEPAFTCPACGDNDLEIASGQDVIVKSMVFEE